jgi:hypothetical protein
MAHTSGQQPNFPTLRFSIVSSLLASLLLLAAGCASTPQDRISQHRRLYESFPADVQRKVSAGQVEIGFTPDMVTLALGEPGRKFSRADASGESEVWVFYRREPHFGFGFGVSSGGYGAVNTGVAVSTANEPDDEVMRVAFHDGKVAEIETRTR